MALIPFVPFTSGAVFTPEIANAIAVPTFDDQTQYFGHLARIKDTDLDTGVNSLMARVGTLGLNLKVSAGSGLNANFAAGRLLYGTTLFTLGASSITLAASSLNYIYGTLSGTIVASTALPPIVRALLATVTTNTTGVIGVQDYREGVSVEVVKPYTLSIRNFGGRGDLGDFLATGNEILNDGEYYFNNFTVPLGKTIIVGKLAYIYCSGVVNIAGQIVVSPASAGGGGVIGSTTNLCIPGQGLGGGVNELLPLTYSFKASPIGSGGSSGFCFGNSPASQLQINTIQGAGGAGGGGLSFEVAGSIVVTGSILANGADATIGLVFDDGVTRYAIGGGGGGSGGSVTLKSLGAIIVSGVISCAAGKGGNGVVGNSQVSAEGGSGGGGGIITIQSPAINTTSSVLTVTGGAAGIAGGSAVVVYRGNGGIGGSYGGVSGQILGDGGAGTAGIVRTQSFTPLG